MTYNAVILIRTWKFHISYIDAITRKCRYRNIAFNTNTYTWSDAWHACIEEALRGLHDTEIVSSIKSTNNKELRL